MSASHEHRDPAHAVRASPVLASGAAPRPRTCLAVVGGAVPGAVRIHDPDDAGLCGGRPDVCAGAIAATAVVAACMPLPLLAAIGRLRVGAAAVAAHPQRKAGRRRTRPSIVGDGRTRFLALCGLYGSTVFLIAVLVDASAVAFFGACPGLPALA